MKVITIHEDGHGFIGIAKNMDSAFRFLIEKNWISELWDEDADDWAHPDVLIEKYNAKDLLDLMYVVKSTVKSKFGVTLEEEVKILGEE